MQLYTAQGVRLTTQSCRVLLNRMRSLLICDNALYVVKVFVGINATLIVPETARSFGTADTV